MARDDDWPERCTLSGCDRPTRRGHHHHMRNGHLSTVSCACPDVDQPGTTRLERRSG